MKLSITQIVIGTLILLIACYIVGWITFGVPSTIPVFDDNRTLKIINALPANEMLLTVGRIASWMFLGLALTVILTGAFQVNAEKGRVRGLAITQAVAGFLIAAICFLTPAWGFPTQFIIPVEAGSNISATEVNINPGPAMGLGRAFLLSMLSVLLGLAVLGVGIAQFVRARKH